MQKKDYSKTVFIDENTVLLKRLEVIFSDIKKKNQTTPTIEHAKLNNYLRLALNQARIIKDLQ